MPFYSVKAVFEVNAELGIVVNILLMCSNGLKQIVKIPTNEKAANLYLKTIVTLLILF